MDIPFNTNPATMHPKTDSAMVHEWTPESESDSSLRKKNLN